jgi:hypothetical protein
VAENPANSNYAIVLDASVKRSMESKVRSGLCA